MDRYGTGDLPVPGKLSSKRLIKSPVALETSPIKAAERSIRNLRFKIRNSEKSGTLDRVDLNVLEPAVCAAGHI